jgi:hypothetical protein
VWYCSQNFLKAITFVIRYESALLPAECSFFVPKLLQLYSGLLPSTTAPLQRSEVRILAEIYEGKLFYLQPKLN